MNGKSSCGPKPDAYSTLLEQLALPSAIEAVHRALTLAFDLDVAERTDRDEALLRVLLCIRLTHDGAMRAKDISRQMLKSTSHISRLIDRAESEGLVERCTDPSDRRAQQVTLTTKGQEEIDAYVPHAVVLLEQAFGTALNPDELMSLLEMLGRVEAATLKLVAERESSRRA